MEFVDTLINVISNDIKSNSSPVQYIINQYITKCYDCKMLLDEEFKCNNCIIIRCRFHHYVNSSKQYCIECQDYKHLSIYYHFNLYMCQKCEINYAFYGYINDIKFCRACAKSEKNYLELIIFGNTCFYKNCSGTGWYINTETLEQYCEKHKTDNTYYFLYYAV